MRRPGEAAAPQNTVKHASRPFDEALADLHALDVKLRRELEQDKRRMNMPHDKLASASKMSVSSLITPSDETSSRELVPVASLPLCLL